jgi:puromycin-sensitive aminopeptidase
MPVSSEMASGPIKTVMFEESPLMSTYLVAMVVGVFDYVEGVTSQGIISYFLFDLQHSLHNHWIQYFSHFIVLFYLGTKVRVYTEVGKSEQGKFALDVGLKLLDFYNE